MRQEGGRNARNTDDASSEERVGATRKTELLEDGRRVVQDRVDTRPLLEEHCQGSDGYAIEERCITRQNR